MLGILSRALRDSSYNFLGCGVLYFNATAIGRICPFSMDEDLMMLGFTEMFHSPILNLPRCAVAVSPSPISRHDPDNWALMHNRPLTLDVPRDTAQDQSRELLGKSG